MLRACETVDLRLGEVLHEPGQRMRHAWFPVAGFMSLQVPAERRAERQVHLIGNEGMLGTPLVLGAEESDARALVMGAGAALRISARSLRRELNHGVALRRTLNRYVHVRMTQLVQNTTCVATHKIKQRLACWLLMSHDRAGTEMLNITQATLADLLGVRRVGITEAAGALQRRGMIRYSRGRLAITDRVGLERVACSCYRTARDTRRRWLG